MAAVKTFQDKQKILIDALEKQKNELKALTEKRKLELGNLLFKLGLEKFDNAVLKAEFEKISNNLNANVCSSPNVSPNINANVHTQ